MMIELLAGERQSNESDNAVIACNDYVRMGIGRSLAKLHQKYIETTSDSAPTEHLRTLAGWSTKFGWVERASQYDATWEERKTAERQAVMDYGLALDYERVNKLKRLADFLEEQIYEQGKDGQFHNIWVPDVKVAGGMTIDIEKFNSALIQQYRSILDDLAKEVGQRVNRTQTELTVDWRTEAKEAGLDPAGLFEELVSKAAAAIDSGD